MVAANQPQYYPEQCHLYVRCSEQSTRAIWLLCSAKTVQCTDKFFLKWIDLDFTIYQSHSSIKIEFKLTTNFDEQHHTITTITARWHSTNSKFMPCNLEFFSTLRQYKGMSRCHILNIGIDFQLNVSNKIKSKKKSIKFLPQTMTERAV